MTTQPHRWLPALAEALTIGDTVRYGKPPKVIQKYGTEAFEAPGTQGMVVDFTNSGATARVRFSYRDAESKLCHSDPLTVLAGQRCEVVR